MDYHKIADEKRRAAQEVLEKLAAGELDKKLQRREELKAELKNLEKELESLLGVDHFSASESRPGRGRASRRRSLPESDKHSRIRALLSQNADGLSAKRIASELDDTYPSVQAYLKKHPELYKRSGEKKSTVYKLVG